MRTAFDMDDPARTADYGYFAHERVEAPKVFKQEVCEMLRLGSSYGSGLRLNEVLKDLTEDLFSNLDTTDMRKLLLLMRKSDEFGQLIEDRIDDYVFDKNGN